MPGPYDGQMGLLAPIARLAGAQRVIVTEHLPRVGRLWKRALIKSFAFAWVDRVLTICRANSRYLVEEQRVPLDKIETVYNGIPATYGCDRNRLRAGVRQRLGLGPQQVGLVFIGSVIERKGVRLLLDALQGMNEADWRLFVVGSGDQESECRRKSSEEGLVGRVEFLGEASEAEVERILMACDALVLPSFLEGMPYVILEAMACSLAVVATDIDGIPEAVPHGEAALLVEPGDTKALRAALARAMRDGPLREALGRRGRERFERCFTLERHLARMESVYMEIFERADARQSADLAGRPE